MDPLEEKTQAPEEMNAVAPETPAEMLESAPAAVAETPQPKYADTFRNRVKAAYPDEEFPDDEVFYQKASEQFDNMEAYVNKNKEANKALMEIIEAEPVVAEVLKDMVRGASFRSAIAKHYGPEELTPSEGAPDEEEYKNNLEMRAKRMKDNEEYNKRRDTNREASAAAVSSFVKNTNLDEAQASEILGKIGEMLDNIYDGKIDENFLMAMHKALKYDSAVKDAEDTGRIAGRNEQIEVKKEGAAKPKGDGQPVLGGGGAPQEQPPKAKTWLDDVYQNEKKRNIL